MKLWSALPKTGDKTGTFWVTDLGGEIILGPVRFRGEADNARAAKANNPGEDPKQPFGDHPFGVSLVAGIVAVPESDTKKRHSYGPYFISLSPVSGDAWTARQNGRTGIGLHGGDLAADGSLRATFGCGRLANDALERLVVDHLRPALDAGTAIFYECTETPA